MCCFNQPPELGRHPLDLAPPVAERKLPPCEIHGSKILNCTNKGPSELSLLHNDRKVVLHPQCTRCPKNAAKMHTTVNYDVIMHVG